MITFEVIDNVGWITINRPEQKHRPARRLAVPVKAPCRKCHLLHRFRLRVRVRPSDKPTMKSFSPYSEFP
jgi:hypothetical protein